MRRAAILLACAAFFSHAAQAAAPGPWRADAAARAAAWLAGQDRPFFSGEAPADGLADATVALVAGGASRSSIDRALAGIRARGPARAAERAAYAGRLAMAIVAAGGNPRAFGGHDYVARIRSFYDPVTGTYDLGSAQYSNTLAMLGLRAAGEPLPEQAMRALRLGRCPDGGFSFDPGCSKTRGSDVDTTALVVNLLVAARVPAGDDVRESARAFLASAANAEGGFGFYAGEATNANSTGLALTAIAALGESPAAPPWRRGGRDPLAALLGLQSAEGGFRYASSRTRTDGYATVQAIPGAAGEAYPVMPRAPGAGERQTRTRRPTQPVAPAAPAPRSSSPASSGAPVVAPVVKGAQAAPAAVVKGEGDRSPAGRAAPLGVAGAAFALSAVFLGITIRRRA